MRQRGYYKSERIISHCLFARSHLSRSAVCSEFSRCEFFWWD